MREYFEIDVNAEEFRLFNRLLLSYNDFNQAYEVANELLEKNYYSNYPQNRTLVHALNLTVIVAYSRPFKISRGQLALKRLPEEIISDFDSEQMKIHQQVLSDRDTMMAHSDADANNTIPHAYDMGHKRILVPINSNPYAKPLIKGVMKKLAAMALDLQEKVFEMRMEIEPKIIDKLPLADTAAETKHEKSN